MAKTNNDNNGSSGSEGTTKPRDGGSSYEQLSTQEESQTKGGKK